MHNVGIYLCSHRKYNGNNSVITYLKKRFHNRKSSVKCSNINSYIMPYDCQTLDIVSDMFFMHS